MRLGLWLSLFALGCGRITGPAQSTPRAPSSAGSASHTEVLSGQLVTYKASRAVGLEEYQDDGDHARSRVRLGLRRYDIELSRTRQTVTCDGHMTRLDADTVALENGNWQAYAVAADRVKATDTPRRVNVLLPCAGVRLGGTLSVLPEGADRRVVLHLGALTISVLVSARGVVTDATVAAQDLTVRPPSAAAPSERKALPPPKDVTEAELSVDRGGVLLKGTVWIPERAEGKVPVALIVAGSGPTDRDGNNALGVRSDVYRQIAAELATRGIATVRYDKRGVGASGANFDYSTVVLEDFVQDALAWMTLVQRDTRLGQLTVIGHSEGGLVSILAAERQPCDALVLIAAPGRPMELLLREQLARTASPSLLQEYDRIVHALRERKPLGTIPEPLAPLFNPTGRAFFASELGIDPAAELKKAQAPRVSILQGSTDLQVSMDDARGLASARPGARLHALTDVNHVLKRELTRVSPQASYTDPTLPLAPGVVDALVAGIAR